MVYFDANVVVFERANTKLLWQMTETISTNAYILKGIHFYIC